MKDIVLIDMKKAYFPVHFDSRDKMCTALEWVNELESNGNYALGGRTIYFENPEDAEWCALRWT